MCAAAGKGKSPFCDLVETCSLDASTSSSLSYCSNQNSDQLLSRMCASDFAGNPSCSGSLTSTNSNPINSIPTARNASNAIYLICNEMPMMADCKICPPPLAQTGLSDCPLLDTLSKLCRDMPGMTECSRFSSFCSANPNSSFCGDSSNSATTVLQSSFCTDAKEICINATFVSSSETCFTVSANTEGWVSLGMGRSVMAGSDMYLAWQDGDQLQIGNFQGTGPVQPSYRSDQSSLKSSRLIERKSSTSPFIFEFCRNNVVSQITIVETTPFLYAWSLRKPASGDIKSASIQQHDGGFDAFIFPKPIAVTLASSTSPFSDSVANSLSDEVCNQMPYMTSCSLKNSGSVSPVQSYATICNDMPSMSSCSTFNQSCRSSTASACKPVTNFPSTEAVTKAIYSICTQMNMPECSTCSSLISSSNQSYASCDLMGTFTKLCQSMPDMLDCKLYSSMCSSTPSLSFCSVSLAPPAMKMYFHTGILDYVLIESWVPRTTGQYIGALFFIFFLSFGVKGVEYISTKWEWEWEKNHGSATGVSKSIENPAVIVVGEDEESVLKKESGGSWNLKSVKSSLKSDLIRISLLRCGIQFLINGLHLLVMLIAMTFNLGFFLVALFGLSLGAAIFKPLAYRFQYFENNRMNDVCC